MAETRLRPMREDELEQVRSWRNADPVRRKMYTTHAIGADEHRAWWTRAQTDPATRLMIFEHDGRASAVISYTRYSGPGGSTTLAFYADPARVQRQIAAALEFRAFEHAFEVLEVMRVEGEVIDLNAAVMRFHLRSGIRLEGLRRQAYVRDGQAHDVYCMGVLRQDWQAGMRAALQARAQGPVPDGADWTDRHLRCALPPPAPGDIAPEAALAHAAVSRLVGHWALAGARLVSQSLRFSAVPAGETGLRARVVTHVGRRLLCAVRVLQAEAEIASGYLEFELPAVAGEQAA